MKSFFRAFPFLIPLLTCFHVRAQELSRTIIINEVMQSTFGGEYDLLNEYPDGWVELYNPGNTALSLKDYRIGKKNKFKKCYTLPDISIPSKGHLVVYCDKADTVVTTGGWSPETEIHADFRLTTDVPSSVYLFAPDKTLVDTLGLPKMLSPNVAYGRLTDGADSLGLELRPSKGSENSGGHALGVLPQPLFYDSSISSDPSDNSGSSSVIYAYRSKRLMMETLNGKKTILPSDAVIRYTIDGSEPTEESPIMSSKMFVKNSTVFKASIFAENYITPPAGTRVVLYNGHTPSLPIVSLVALDEDLNSDAHGIIKRNNSEKVEDRFNWRRPAYFDYFSKGSTTASFSQRCEIRVGGAWTRSNPLKTLIVYADKRFGTTDYFDAVFWPSNRSEVTRSKSIALRSAGNDFSGSYIRDAASQLIISKNTDIDWQGFQPAIFYLNAQYKGILNIRERGNEDNIWAHYNNLEDITLIENGELKEGEMSQYQDFVSFYSDPTRTFQEYDSVMDINEYMNLIIISTYMCNTDFPGNNNVLWRPIADGGKWRWILKDVDRSFNVWGWESSKQNYKLYLNWILRTPPYCMEEKANSEEHTLLIRNLMQIDEFKQKFIDRFTVYLGGQFRSECINDVLDWCHKELAPEWDYFHAVQSVKSKSSWESEISGMKNWAEGRTAFMKSYLKDFYSLGKEIPAKVSASLNDASSLNISINDITLSDGVFDGSLYSGRRYVLKGYYGDGQYNIVGWDVMTQSSFGSSNQRVMDEELVLTLGDEVSQIEIRPVKGVNGIETSDISDIEIVRVVYTNTLGVTSTKPFDGINIIRYYYNDGSVITDTRLINK